MKDYITQYDILHYTPGNNLLVTGNSKQEKIYGNIVHQEEEM